MNLSPKYYYLIVVVIAIIFYLPFIGNVHLFDWDENIFAECTREMIVSGDFMKVQINFNTFWEKPPMFFWFQLISMKLFGINEFAARFPNVICGILSLLLIFHIGKKHFSLQFACIWVLAMLGSLMPHFYFKTGMIDPFFNLFIFSSWYCFYLYFTSKYKLKYLLFAALSIGFGILTKGPVAILILSICLTYFYFIFRKKVVASISHFGIFSVVVLLLTTLWFGYETIKHGAYYIVSFIVYQYDLLTKPVASHGQPFYYHPIVLLIGCFPVSVLGLPKLIGNFSNEKSMSIEWWMRTIFWVVLILFSFVTTKLVHYSSLCYMPLSFLATLQITQVLESKKGFSLISKILFVCIGFILSFVFMVIGLIETLKKFAFPYIDDKFAVASFSLNVEWGNWEWIIGVFFLIILITFIFMPKYLLRTYFILFLGIAIFINVFLAVIMPKIEKYVQGPLIEFIKSKADEDAYVYSYGFVSYATSFYGKIKKYENPKYYDLNYLINNKIDKPLFIIAKYPLEKNNDMKKFDLIECKGGFCFLKKKINFIENGK